jgi:pSer/pThr/pTyr-binding forkhead associated (FHA) protein/MinD-like ATPase involved in chromosome partitioning or flagellar assembly
MICASCRTVNLEGMVFCAKCGRGLATTSAEDPGNIPRLIWQIGDGTPQTFLLTKAVTTIGRVGGNDIILPEAGVSRQHSRLERSGTRCILVDLGSLNGTLVNNERIEQERDLVDGDVIRIGRTALQISIPENIASVSNAPSVGTRITDKDTMEQGGGRPPAPAAEEGPATVFDMPVPGAAPAASAPDEAPDVVPDADRTVAGDLDADRTVSGGDVPWDELVAAAQASAPAQKASDAAFWLVTNDGTRVPVDEPVTLGRGEDNTIVLSQDRQVSRHHARISAAGAYLRLEDLGSANGTLLNNQKVAQPETVTAGDEIKVGGTTLRVERAAAPGQAPAAEGDARTLHMEEEESDKTISGAEFAAELAAAGPPAGAPAMVVEAGDQPRLTFTWGPQSGQSFPLDREVLVIGREGGSAEADVSVQDRAVSSPHAKLVRSGGGVTLHDLDSTNGTFLNYEQIHEPKALADGDLIKVGKSVLLYRTAAGAMAPPAAAHGATGGPSSQVITFFSLKGGVGTTTMAVNTALLVRELTKESVLLIDLSVERASVTSQLNFEVRRTIDDLASLPHLDPDAIAGIVAHHSSGLDILPAPPSPQTAELVTSEFMSQLFPILKEHYRWIILDTAASFSDLNLSSFDQSDLVVVLTAPDLSTLKTTQSCLDVFSALQTTGERRLLLLNTIYPKSRLEKDEIEKALGERIDLVVPYGEEVLQAIDHGVPIALSARQHPTVMALDGFVRKIAEVKEPAPATRAARGGFWLKLKGIMHR